MHSLAWSLNPALQAPYGEVGPLQGALGAHPSRAGSLQLLGISTGRICRPLARTLPPHFSSISILLSGEASSAAAFAPCTRLPHPPWVEGRLSQQASSTGRNRKRLGNSCAKSNFNYKSGQMLLGKTNVPPARHFHRCDYYVGNALGTAFRGGGATIMQ